MSPLTQFLLFAVPAFLIFLAIVDYIISRNKKKEGKK